IFEPGEEIEGLAEVAAVIELPRHLRQIFQAGRDVMRLRFQNLAPLVLAQRPPRRRFPDRDQRRRCRLVAAERRLLLGELLLLGLLDIAHRGGDARQPPGGGRRQDRQRDRGALRDRERRYRGKGGALDGRIQRDPPVPALSASKRREHGAIQPWNPWRFNDKPPVNSQEKPDILRISLSQPYIPSRFARLRRPRQT